VVLNPEAQARAAAVARVLPAASATVDAPGS
jgi:hypothetical protein